MEINRLNLFLCIPTAQKISLKTVENLNRDTEQFSVADMTFLLNEPYRVNSKLELVNFFE